MRVSTTDSLAIDFLIPAIARLHEQHPDVRVQLDASTQILSLAKREADIAVRNPSRQVVNPTADAYWLVNLSWRLPLQTLWPRAPTGTSVQTVVYNLLDEAIYQPEFVGQRINTIPARSQRWFKLELNWQW